MTAPHTTVGALVCPGVPGAARHNGGCCAAFAAMTPAQRLARGVVRHARPVTVERPVPPPPPVTTVAQLADLVTARQQAEAHAGGPVAHPEQIVWVEIGDTDPAEAAALIDMSRAYGIVAGWR